MFTIILRQSFQNCRQLLRTYSQNANETWGITAVQVKNADDKLPNRTEPENNVNIDSQLTEPVKTSVNVYEATKLIHPEGLFAAYIKDSGLLQELFRLGVNLHKIEKDSEAVQFLLRLQFNDIREHILFLKDLSLSTEDIGSVITNNPFILSEDLDDLNVRINYLQYKKFKRDMITRIVSNNPVWLSHSTKDIDSRLGFFQKQFELSGAEVRQLTVTRPTLITYPLEKVNLNNFTLKEEMGFTTDEVKGLVLRKPKLLVTDKNKILDTFTYVHKIMNMPLERISQEPEILLCRKKRLKQRHLFLVKLERAQYDPLKPNYVSLVALVSGSDSEFSTEVGKSSVQMFNDFLKTL